MSINASILFAHGAKFGTDRVASIRLRDAETGVAFSAKLLTAPTDDSDAAFADAAAVGGMVRDLAYKNGKRDRTKMTGGNARAHLLAVLGGDYSALSHALTEPAAKPEVGAIPPAALAEPTDAPPADEKPSKRGK